MYLPAKLQVCENECGHGIFFHIRCTIAQSDHSQSIELDFLFQFYKLNMHNYMVLLCSIALPATHFQELKTHVKTYHIHSNIKIVNYLTVVNTSPKH